MKTLLVVLAFSASLPALAALNWEGKFSHAHQIAFLSYDEKGCAEDKGRWESDVCVFDAEDTVTVAKDLTVSVSTVTTNAHTCDFEAKGRLVGANVIDAKDGTCQLRLTFSDSNTVAVKNLGSYDSCQDHCGMNAGLDIEKAVRAK